MKIKSILYVGGVSLGRQQTQVTTTMAPSIAQVAVRATARTSVCKSLVAHGRAATVAVIGMMLISAVFIGILRTSAKTLSSATVAAMLIISVADIGKVQAMGHGVQVHN